MRLENSIKNAKASFVAQILTIILGFFNRVVFIKYLGSDYLGFSGLFSNILSMLSLAELGLGSAIIYNLYKPMHEGDNEKLAELCNFYKKVYVGIAGVVFVLGIVFVPFLQVFIKDIDEIPFTIEYIRKIYVLSLAEIVVSYLFVYRTSMLSVGQQTYIVTNIRSVFSIVLSLVRVVILYLTANYIFYLVVGIITNILVNICASIVATKKFPFVFDKCNKKKRLKQSEKNSVIKNAIDLSIHNFSGFIVNCTDNLIISSFVGIEAVGLLSNYLLIQSTVRQFIASIAEAVQAPLGDLVSEGDKNKSRLVINRMAYLFFVIGAFCAISMCALSDDFVELLFGKQFVISFDIVLICSINLFIWTMTRTIWKLSMVTGLFKKDKLNSVTEAVVNAVISIVAVQFLGVFGTFLGTACSYIVAYLLKVRLQFSMFFEHSPKEFLGRVFRYCMLFVFEIVTVLFIARLVNSIVDSSLYRMVIKGVFCLVLPNAINIVLYKNTDEGQYLKYIFETKVLKKINRKN